MGRSEVDWSISVLLFNVARKSSFCVASRDCVILGRLSCGCVDRGRVVLCRFGVVLDRFGGVISGSLGVVGWGSMRSPAPSPWGCSNSGQSNTSGRQCSGSGQRKLWYKTLVL